MVVHGDDYFLDDDLFPIVDDLLNNKSLGDGAATENTFSVSGYVIQSKDMDMMFIFYVQIA